MTSQSETTQPPKKHGIHLSTSWPFVKIEQVRENRGEHGTMFAITAIITLVLASQTTFTTALIAAPAFVAGYALNNWLVFPDLYGDSND